MELHSQHGYGKVVEKGGGPIKRKGTRDEALSQIEQQQAIFSS